MIRFCNMEESRRRRFKRLATKRANGILYKLKVLGNCSNKSFYDYTEGDVNKIFGAIEEQFRFVKSKFKKPTARVKL